MCFPLHVFRLPLPSDEGATTKKVTPDGDSRSQRSLSDRVVDVSLRDAFSPQPPYQDEGEDTSCSLDGGEEGDRVAMQKVDVSEESRLSSEWVKEWSSLPRPPGGSGIVELMSRPWVSGETDSPVRPPPRHAVTDESPSEEVHERTKKETVSTFAIQVVAVTSLLFLRDLWIMIFFLSVFFFMNGGTLQLCYRHFCRSA